MKMPSLELPFSIVSGTYSTHGWNGGLCQGLNNRMEGEDRAKEAVAQEEVGGFQRHRPSSLQDTELELAVSVHLHESRCQLCFL